MALVILFVCDNRSRIVENMTRTEASNLGMDTKAGVQMGVQMELHFLCTYISCGFQDVIGVR